MPESKTIEIDEIVTPEKSAGDASGQDGHIPLVDLNTNRSLITRASWDPFADFHKALPWKARLTLKLTQWFMLLRSKSWGKFVIVPIIILGVLLVIPLGLIAIFVLIIRSIFFPRRY